MRKRKRKKKTNAPLSRIEATCNIEFEDGKIAAYVDLNSKSACRYLLFSLPSDRLRRRKKNLQIDRERAGFEVGSKDLGEDRGILFEISKLSQSGHELTFRVSRWSRLKGWQEGRRGLKEGAEQGCRTRNRCRRKRQVRRERSYSRWKRKRRWWWRKRQGWKGKCGDGDGVCVCVCMCARRTRLCNPFRESAERGTQTPEWGKNSVSSPLPSTLFLCLQRGFPALPYTPVSHGSRLRGNQAKHKLGRRIVAGNIYKP